MEDVAVTFGGVYAGRRVLVTGHTGFKGGWLTLWLSSLGAEVHGYALPPATTPSLFAVAGVADACASSELADIRDRESLARAVQRIRPELVFHLAAQPLVLESYRTPVETFATNVMGTVHLLEAVRATGGVRVVQVITSDKCYEDQAWDFAYRENDRLGGKDPYSASKACAELAAAAYRASFFGPDAEMPLSLATVRAGNVIGGGDWAMDRIIPDCVAALAAGRPVQVRNPDAVRPWQHVLEPLSGYLSLAAAQWDDPGAWAEAWNFGPRPESAVPVQVLVDLLRDAWEGEALQTTTPAAAPGRARETHHLRVDASKARARLGWAPALDLRTAVAYTAEWYRGQREDHAGFDARSACLAQIDAYAQAASAAGAAWALPAGACA